MPWKIVRRWKEGVFDLTEPMEDREHAEWIFNFLTGRYVTRTDGKLIDTPMIHISADPDVYELVTCDGDGKVTEVEI
jgi:hypothetical protein